ncbi:hypothetical protein NQ314_012342 [Rhamnusium bicolor]|uniref:Uncharacterized protein n=1 Tax=Rhamnusium bicolor TaxID=1586634 RepID=A0AAV8XDJ9_9CUCU|nr:hypothetical protein NQ314_012342 [Rhamnusium bicolor]
MLKHITNGGIANRGSRPDSSMVMEPRVDQGPHRYRSPNANSSRISQQYPLNVSQLHTTNLDNSKHSIYSNAVLPPASKTLNGGLNISRARNQSTVNKFIAKSKEVGVKEMLVSLGLLCLISPVTANDIRELLRSEQLTVITAEEYVVVYEVTLALCALTLSLNLCCLLVCAIQFLFAVKLVKSPHGGNDRKKKMSKLSERNREDKLRKRRERGQERRRKIREDPIKNQEQKEKEHQKYLRQKQEKIRSISEEEYLNNATPPTSDDENIEPERPHLLRQNDRSMSDQRRSQKNKVKHHTKKQTLLEKIKKLKSEAAKFKKRYQRLKSQKEESQDPLTPNTKTIKAKQSKGGESKKTNTARQEPTCMKSRGWGYKVKWINNFKQFSNDDLGESIRKLVRETAQNYNTDYKVESVNKPKCTTSEEDLLEFGDEEFSSSSSIVGK